MAKEFAGKSVLITGAASGIGKAAAYRWAAEGAKVCIADMDIPRAEKVAEDIRAIRERGRVQPELGRECADTRGSQQQRRRQLGRRRQPH